MFLFQYGSRRSKGNIHITLHSIMFLFQYSNAGPGRYAGYLYIPLCFYFNLYVTADVENKVYALHSIMFLFQWVSALAKSYCTCLYIPLCFYFNLLCLLILHFLMSLHSIMFLFQWFRCAPLDGLLKSLHSIMFLFQSRIARALVRGINLYIPLCFYFNAEFASERIDNRIDFTFHYVSISICAAVEFPHISESLHSIMFLFQCSRIGTTYRWEPLYIPLCFYFNDLLGLLWKTGLSLYILLYFYFNKRCRNGTLYVFWLYIPLCFYFNQMLDYCREKLSRLYIPLCLYFNKSCHQTRRNGCCFTFHYVSILIGTGKTILAVMNNFTFHYVSILMNQTEHQLDSALHFTFHYVSILITATYFRTSLQSSFTFHYVSILITLRT